MINRMLELMIRKLVTVYYKRTKFLTWSWGIDEQTDIHILPETFTETEHRFGLHVESFEVEE